MHTYSVYLTFFLLSLWINEQRFTGISLFEGSIHIQNWRQWNCTCSAFLWEEKHSIRFRIEALLFIIRKGRDDHSSLILLHMIWWVMIEKWTVFFRINYHFYKSGKFNCNMIDFLANVYCGFIYTASIQDMNISRQSTVWQWSSLVNIREYRQPPLVIVLLLKRGGHIYIKWVGY